MSRGPYEEPMAGLFEDLEQQAEGMHLAERDAEIAERARAEYATVPLAARLHASMGTTLRLGVVGVGFVEGRVLRAGPEWLGLRGSLGGAEHLSGPVSGQDWILRIAALRTARGVSAMAVSEGARPVVARLGIGSVLRGLERSRTPVVVHHLDGSSTTGVVARVGADFVELAPRGDHDGGRFESARELVSLRWTAAIRTASGG